jgi:hypothetical protein
VGSSAEGSDSWSRTGIPRRSWQYPTQFTPILDSPTPSSTTSNPAVFSTIIIFRFRSALFMPDLHAEKGLLLLSTCIHANHQSFCTVGRDNSAQSKAFFVQAGCETGFNAGHLSASSSDKFSTLHNLRPAFLALDSAAMRRPEWQLFNQNYPQGGRPVLHRRTREIDNSADDKGPTLRRPSNQ